MLVRITLAGTVILSALTSSGCEPADEFGLNSPLPQCELILELPATLKRKTYGHAKVHIRNVGDTPALLVLPRDGSESHWRTPLVGWSVLPLDSPNAHPTTTPVFNGERCGNYAGLKRNDLFVLQPGESREISNCVSFPSDMLSGKYRAVFYYANVPNHKWTGGFHSEHESFALPRLARSSPISLISNEVQFEVTD